MVRSVISSSFVFKIDCKSRSTLYVFCLGISSAELRLHLWTFGSGHQNPLSCKSQNKLYNSWFECLLWYLSLIILICSAKWVKIQRMIKNDATECHIFLFISHRRSRIVLSPSTTTTTLSWRMASRSATSQGAFTTAGSQHSTGRIDWTRWRWLDWMRSRRKDKALIIKESLFTYSCFHLVQNRVVFSVNFLFVCLSICIMEGKEIIW